MEEFQYTLNVTPATVQGLDNMIITCSSAVQVAIFLYCSYTVFFNDFCPLMKNNYV